MSRVISAPPRAVPHDDDDEASVDITKQMTEFLPSWLTSFVVHLALVLVLALLVISDSSWKSDTIALDFQAGADGSDGSGQLEDAIELPSELAAQDSEELQDHPLESLSDETIDQPDIQMAELPLPALLAGTGDGEDETNGGTDGGPGIKSSPVRTQVFGLAAEGGRFVYVFDRSESMNSVLTFSSEGEAVFSITPLEAAKAELLRSLKDLNDGNEFGIVFYNHSPWLFTIGRRNNSMLAATPGNKRKASQFVKSMYGFGKTEHMKPLEIALRMKPDVIFLLTDGERKDDLMRDQLEKLKRLNERNTQINVIQFCYKEQDGGSLVELAEQHGGKHIFFNIAKLGPRGPGDLPPDDAPPDDDSPDAPGPVANAGGGPPAGMAAKDQPQLP